ncbi:hypothetical protein PsYK624_095710 [Phanerochaete sordida]|uniref:Uncharacterized protein n=1 Tax=Phanerochaete sordida TaxID=48140 RepID=A0A9P3GCW3_9APHY|nr:hypothetical protein PsYK624_095710 [Phanerochaete sordida]
MFDWFRSPQTIDRVYARSLGALGCGYPVWLPEPHDSGETHIGDVGFMLDGRLIRLFNIDTAVKEKKVLFWKPPFAHIEPLPEGSFIINRRPNLLPSGTYCSHGVYQTRLQAAADA